MNTNPKFKHANKNLTTPKAFIPELASWLSCALSVEDLNCCSSYC